jgi:hypothetical protein
MMKDVQPSVLGGRLRMRWLWRSTILTVVAALVIGVWHVCRVIYRVHSVESDYISTLFILDLVEDYVTKHREWPRSWHDLEQVKRKDEWEWPEESQSIRQRVTIDFDASIDELAKQSADEFEAIRPIERNELYNDKCFGRVHVKSLLKTVREIAGTE